MTSDWVWGFEVAYSHIYSAILNDLNVASMIWKAFTLLLNRFQFFETSEFDVFKLHSSESQVGSGTRAARPSDKGIAADMNMRQTQEGCARLCWVCTLKVTQEMSFLLLLLPILMYPNGGRANSQTEINVSPRGPTLTLEQCASTRSLDSIIWSCLLTTSLCSWVALHPNISPEGECGQKTLRRRLGIMFWTLCAPALVLAWAAKQRVAAQEIAASYNRHKSECDIHALLHIRFMFHLQFKDLKPEARNAVREWFAGAVKPRSKGEGAKIH